jgi:hypothetical protein
MVDVGVQAPAIRNLPFVTIGLKRNQPAPMSIRVIPPEESSV